MYAGPGTPMMQPMLGSSHYPPSFSYAQNTPHAELRGGTMMGNRLVTGGVGAVKGAFDMGQNLVMGAGLLNFGSRMLGAPILSSALIGTSANTGLAMGLLGGPVGAGLMIGSAVAGVGLSGVQQANQVGTMFGNMQFANAYGDPRTGRGFSQRDLMTLQRGIHNIEANNPFVSMSDALRATERFTEMGMHQGIQDAEKLAKRVTQLGKTMHEMARRLGTSMEEAGSIFRDMRGSGFYTAQDVMGNTASMTLMRGFGMSSDQFAAMQRAGAGMTRSAQMSGLGGARTMTAMTEQFMGAVKSGAMSPEQMMDITGASTPLEAAQMLAQQTLSGTMQGLSGGLGTAMLLAAGQVDKSGRFTGGVDRGIIESMSAGVMTRDQMSRIAGGKRNTREGQASFVARKQDIMSSMLETGEGQDALLGMIKSLTEQQFGVGAGENEDLFQLVAETQMNMDRRTVRNLQKLRDTRKQRMDAAVQELRTNARAAELKETRTLGGLYARVTGTFSDLYETAVMPFSEGYRDVTGGLQDVERYLLGGGNDVIAGASQRALDNAIIGDMTRGSQGLAGASPQMAIGDAARIAAITGDFSVLKSALPAVSESTRASLRSRRSSEKIGKDGKVRVINTSPSNIDLGYEMRRLRESGGSLTDETTLLDLATKLNLGTTDSSGLLGASATTRNFDKDQLFALIAEQGGEAGLKLVTEANVGRTEGGGSAKDIKELQLDAKRAMYGDSFLSGATDADMREGRIAAAPGIGGAIGNALLVATAVLDTDTEEAVTRLAEGGETAGLLKVYSDNQQDIDNVLSGLVTDDDFEVAAEKINSKYGLKISGRDLKDMNTMLKGRTGQGATDRARNGVSREITEAISKAAGALDVKVATTKRQEKLQGLATAAAAQGLKGIDSNQQGIRSAIEQLAQKDFSAATNASEAERVLGFGVQVFKQLEQVEKGGLTVKEAMTATGLDEETLNRVLAATGAVTEGGMIKTTDAAGLRSTLAGVVTEGVGLSGKAEQFLNAGMSETERQSLSIYKTAEMVDGLYEKLRADNVINMQNPEG